MRFLLRTRVLSLAVTLLTPAVASEARPNIVFFFTDDQSTDTVGCYGAPIIQTPTLDKLAGAGVRFDRAYVSQPICWVSRKSILSGLTGRGFGMPERPDRARPETVETLFTDILRESGYRTGYFGKWHAMMPQGYRPADHFDEYEHIFRDPFFKKMPDGSLRHETDLIVDRGIGFIKEQPADRPFMLNLWFNACHAEDNDRRPGAHFAWPPSANGLYEDVELPGPVLGDPRIFESQPDFLRTSITRERFFWRWNTDAKYDTNMRAYLRMVSGIDHAIGRFIEALEETGFADNTIIVYSADNGFHMGNRGFAGKWSHYEESIRVPLIVYDPRLPAEKRGRTTDAAALNVDFPATFLDWAGLAIPDRYQGRSLAPLVAGEMPADWPKFTFHEHYAVRHRIPAWEGVRGERFKYARYIDHGGYEFLHDLEKDPHELVNLAHDPEHASVLEKLRTELDRMVDEFGGPLRPSDRKFEPSTPPHPEAAAAVTERPGADGWVTLFDGKSLRGWDGDRAHWSVADGVITGTGDGPPGRPRFLSWKGSTIHNFDLRLMASLSPAAVSGVQYRAAWSPETGLDACVGYEFLIDADRPGTLMETEGRGILAHPGQKVVIATDGKPWTVGDIENPSPSGDKAAKRPWHEVRIVARGNRLYHWIDGRPAVDVVDLDEQNRALGGVLALRLPEDPEATVRFKDIRIRHLPDALPMAGADEFPIPDNASPVKTSD